MQIIIAKVANFHGVKGEMKLISQSDFIAERLSPGNDIQIDEVTYVIKSYRTHKNFHMIMLEDISNVNEVEHLKGKDVYQRIDTIEENLDSDEYHYSDIIGLRVFTVDGRELGMVNRIIETGAKDVLVIDGDKEYMIPFVDEFVTSIDIESGVMEVSPIEGMI